MYFNKFKIYGSSTPIYLHLIFRKRGGDFMARIKLINLAIGRSAKVVEFLGGRGFLQKMEIQGIKVGTRIERISLKEAGKPVIIPGRRGVVSGANRGREQRRGLGILQVYIRIVGTETVISLGIGEASQIIVETQEKIKTNVPYPNSYQPTWGST